MTDHKPRPSRSVRAQYRRFVPISTRWHDNDVFGHVNNVVYYAFFDTAVNRMLVETGCLDPVAGPVVGLVVETRCTYFDSLAFPDPVDVGLRVDRVGRSSVRYALGVFKAGEDQAAAQGDFTHVYVDRASRRPVAVPGELRDVLRRLSAE